MKNNYGAILALELTAHFSPERKNMISKALQSL